MNRPLKLLCSLFLVSFCSLSYAENFQSGNYPRFSYATLFSSGEKVNEKPNVVLNAIENGNALPLRFDSTFKGAKKYIFPVKYFGSSYNIDKLMSAKFVSALSDLVGDFACAEYRFRKDLAEAQGCNGYTIDSDKKEHMPFVSGQYKKNRLEVNLDDKKNRVSFYAYLASGQEIGLDSAFGSVHELGTFFGKLANRRSLMLSINLQAYWLDSDYFRKEKINANTLTYFLILPKAVDIAKQESEMAAANYAVKNARLLILGQQ